MKVVVLTSSWPKHADDPAGSFVVQSCLELQGAGADLVVHPLEPGIALAGARVEALMPEINTEVGGLPSRLRRRPDLLFKIAKQLLRRRLDWCEAERVVSHWALPFPLLAQTSGVSPERLRTWCHGSGLRLPGAGIALGKAHRVALVAAHQRAALPQRFRRLTSVLPVPIQAHFGTLTKSEKTLVFVGRLVAQKGVQLLPKILDELPGWGAQVVGDGPLREQLLGDARIRCLGAQSPQDWPAMIAPGVGVCLSESAEGAPMVIDELRALGLPVVVSAVDGLAQAVRHEQDGWLVRGRDPRRWAQAILAAQAFGQPCSSLSKGRSDPQSWQRFVDWVMT